MKQFDGRDGNYDGEFTPLAHLVSDCQQIPTPALLEDLKTLHDEGACPDELLDGVGLTELKDGVCQDVWGARCGAVQSGLFSCEVDFCNTTPTASAPCDLAGLCDQTCGFCGHFRWTGAGKRRRHEPT